MFTKPLSLTSLYSVSVSLSLSLICFSIIHNCTICFWAPAKCAWLYPFKNSLYVDVGLVFKNIRAASTSSYHFLCLWVVVVILCLRNFISDGFLDWRILNPHFSDTKLACHTLFSEYLDQILTSGNSSCWTDYPNLLLNNQQDNEHDETKYFSNFLDSHNTMDYNMLLNLDETTSWMIENMLGSCKLNVNCPFVPLKLHQTKLYCNNTFYIIFHNEVTTS